MFSLVIGQEHFSNVTATPLWRFPTQKCWVDVKIQYSPLFPLHHFSTTLRSLTGWWNLLTLMNLGGHYWCLSVYLPPNENNLISHFNVHTTKLEGYIWWWKIICESLAIYGIKLDEISQFVATLIYWVSGFNLYYGNLNLYTQNGRHWWIYMV